MLEDLNKVYNNAFTPNGKQYASVSLSCRPEFTLRGQIKAAFSGYKVN